MFCIGMSNGGRMYRGAPGDKAKVLAQEATKTITSSAIKMKLLEPSTTQGRTKGHVYLNSDYFAALCGSVSMMNREHLDKRDKADTFIVWRRLGRPSTKLYFLIEFKKGKRVAVKVEDGTMIRLNAREARHRSVLIGGNVKKALNQDGTFDRLRMNHAMKTEWDEDKSGWAGFALVPR